jgi:hypothetical protein
MVSVGVGAKVQGGVLPPVRYVGGDRMDPLRHVQDALLGTGARMGWCADLHGVVIELADRVDPDRCSGEVAGQSL